MELRAGQGGHRGRWCCWRQEINMAPAAAATAGARDGGQPMSCFGQFEPCLVIVLNMEDSLVYYKHASQIYWFKFDLTDVLAVNQVAVELLASGNINLLLRTLTRHTSLQSFTNWPAHPPPCCSITRNSPGQHLHCQLPTCYLSTRQPVNLSTCQPVNLSTCQPVNLLTYQPVNLLACQHVNMSTCQPVNLSTWTSEYLNIWRRKKLWLTYWLTDWPTDNMTTWDASAPKKNK